MRRAVTAFLLALCFFAATYEGTAAQERTKKTTTQTGAAATAEPVGSLVSLLKKARGYTIPRTQTTQRLGRVRAEGCVLRYNVVSEYESQSYRSQGSQLPSYYPSDRPQILSSDYRIAEREMTINLSDLDAARVRVYVRDRLKRESGGSVIFGTTGGKESVREQWLQYTRLGVRPMTRWSKGGGLQFGDAGSLELIAAALRRAAEVCGADAR